MFSLVSWRNVVVLLGFHLFSACRVRHLRQPCFYLVCRVGKHRSRKMQGAHYFPSPSLKIGVVQFLFFFLKKTAANLLTASLPSTIEASATEKVPKHLTRRPRHPQLGVFKTTAKRRNTGTSAVLARSRTAEVFLLCRYMVGKPNIKQLGSATMSPRVKGPARLTVRCSAATTWCGRRTHTGTGMQLLTARLSPTVGAKGTAACYGGRSGHLR